MQLRNLLTYLITTVNNVLMYRYILQKLPSQLITSQLYKWIMLLSSTSTITSYFSTNYTITGAHYSPGRRLEPCCGPERAEAPAGSAGKPSPCYPGSRDRGRGRIQHRQTCCPYAECHCKHHITTYHCSHSVMS